MIVVDLVVDALERAQSGHLFTVTTRGPVGPVVEAAARRGLDIVATANEELACLMAAVRGSLLDAPGFVAIDDGERARAALAQAMRDRSPLVLVSGLPLAGDVQGIVKTSVPVEPATAAHWSAHAVQLAMTDPRGPVQLVVPPGVATEPAVPLATSVRPASATWPSSAALDLAADRLAAAVRPVLLVGLGCRSMEMATWIRALAESLPAPVLVTRKGKGAVPDPHPLHLGLIERVAGRHPVLDRADLLVTIGVDPSEVRIDDWPPSLAVLHLATIPSIPCARAGTGFEAVGDLSVVIAELAPRLRGRQRADWDVAEIDRLKRAAALPSSRVLGPQRLSSHTVAGAVREAMPAGTIAVVVADDELDLIAAWQTVSPGELVVPTPPAIPGFALAAAVAARLARPYAGVVAFVSAREVLGGRAALTAAAALGRPLLLVVVGRIVEVASEWEALPRAAVAAGWTATAVSTPNELYRAIEDGMAASGPMLIDAHEPA